MVNTSVIDSKLLESELEGLAKVSNLLNPVVGQHLVGVDLRTMNEDEASKL